MHELKLVPKKEKPWKRLEKGLFVYVPTGMIYVRRSFERERLPELFAPTGETKISRARARAIEMIAEWKNPKTHSKEKRFSEVFEEILRTVTPLRRPATQSMHRIHFTQLDKEWGAIRVNDFSLPAWAVWMEAFKRKSRRKTFADYAKHMNLALNYAHAHRYATHSITVPNPDKGLVPEFRVFTPDELNRLYQNMNSETRDQYVLAYECGMRLREVLHLTWDRYNPETGKVTLRAEDVKTGSKTGKGREFYATPHAQERLLERWKLSGRPTLGPIFVYATTGKSVHQNKTAWRTAKKKAGIRGKAKWHSLRHTAITHMLFPPNGSKGADPLFVSEYCGVSMRTIQRVYLHSTAENTRAVSNALSLKNYREQTVNGEREQ